jgi:hypothetical protein
MAKRMRTGSLRGGAAGLIAAAVVAAAPGGSGCAADPGVRTFRERAIAWQEHDSEDVPRPPRSTDLSDLNVTLTVRDDVAGEIDRALAVEGPRPAHDVNAADEVPCSTWFCPRNHLRPMPLDEIAAGPAGAPPRLPLRIMKGKDQGDAPGFQVVDADGRKFLLKLDPAGHLGMATAAEVIGARLFHAAGYNVPSNFVLDISPDDLVVDPHATFKLYRVQKRPLTPEIVKQRLARAARTPDGRLRAVAVTWLGGKVLGAFDMQGRRPDDPNDRIAHEDRRSLRASWMLAAWLAIYDASAINTLDTYVEEGGRHFVRHYLIDFGAGLGSGTRDVKGPQDGGQYLVEFGRTFASMLSLGLYRRPYQSQRGEWNRGVGAHPAVGWFPAEDFDVDAFRTGRKVPAYRRMTDRDAYWGAKLVTSFTDAQLGAVAAAARIDPGDAVYLARTLAVRRDIIGRRFLTAATAVEAPALVAGAGGVGLCFDDLVIARGYARAEQVRYRLRITDERGRTVGDAIAPAQGARTCVSVPDATGGYRVVAITTELAAAGGAWRPAQPSRIHISGGRVVGLERSD